MTAHFVDSGDILIASHHRAAKNTAARELRQKRKTLETDLRDELSTCSTANDDLQRQVR
jgi:hypothetical protein